MLEVILKIIYESDVEDLKDLVKKTNTYKESKHFKDFLQFDHRTHSNYSIKLKNCDQLHCIECLYSSPNTCIHKQQLTPCEKNSLGVLISLFPSVQDSRIKYKKCRSCLQVTNYHVLESHSCLCAICDNCLVAKYKSRVIKCEYCDKKIKFSCIKKISKELGVPIERFKECSVCKLVFNSSALKNNACTLCEFNVNY